jgi:hypothetical protein
MVGRSKANTGFGGYAAVPALFDHAPDGTPHWHSAPVRCPAGWLASRLAWWTDTAGNLRPAHSAQLAAAAAEHRAAQAEQRAAVEAEAAAVAPPERRREHLAAIRAELVERRRRAENTGTVAAPTTAAPLPR